VQNTNSKPIVLIHLSTTPRVVERPELSDTIVAPLATTSEALRVLVRLLARQAAIEAYRAHFDAEAQPHTQPEI
jgi:hypothetical protein